MAGIGFRLHRLMKEGDFFSSMQSLFFATFLVAGPWLVTMGAIALVSAVSGLQGQEYEVFRTAIVYVYAFSLIVTGFYQMPLTRYLADELYAERLEKVVPAFLGMALVVVGVQSVVGIFYGLLFPFSWMFRIAFQAGLIVVSLLWLVMIFLGCLRDYLTIAWVFAIGAGASVLATLFGEWLAGGDGALFGFFAGQGLILLGLSRRLFVELARPGASPDFSCLKAILKYRDHFWTGVLTNLGIWIDKGIYWFSPLGKTIVPGLYSCPGYDTPMFLAYAATVPALGLFFLSLETSFYESYREFYGAIEQRLPLRIIVRRLAEIKRTLRHANQEIVRVQGIITVLIFVFSPEILAWAGYGAELLAPLRWGIWGGLFQVLFLFASLSLLYFDFPRDALYGSLAFLVLNALGAVLTAWLPFPGWYGAGYLLATLGAFAVTIRGLRRRLKDLVYLTFMRNAFPGEREAEPGVLGPDDRLGEIVLRR